ncbi:hypothetical protein TrST_g13713 [Triparma strigata]|uniref:Uncharacterized protein n=1 Tax=Triparma strigata TaxID=1606541 RepID=A0A9W7EVB3_9STRA|nr:hypothetical protein TrST_g13713 [Triparma strigata]
MKLINSLLLSKAIFALFAASTVSAQTCDQENCGGQTAFCYSDGCASRSEDGIWTGAYAQCNPPDEVGPFYCDACYTDSACGIWDFSCDQENCGSYLLTPCYTTQGCASRSEDGTWNGPYATCNSPELPAPTYCDNCFPTCVGSTDNDSSPSPTMTMMPTTYDSPSPTMTMMPTTYDGPECIPEACQGMITAYTSSASSDESSDFEGPSCEDMQTLLTCLDDNDAEWQENCGEEQSDLSDSSDSTTTSTIVLSSLSIYDLIMLFYDQSCQSNSPSPTMTYSPSPSHSPSPSPSPSHSPSPSPSPSPTSAPTTSPLRTQTTEVKQTIKTESTLPDNTNHTNVINILVEAWCENLDNQ